MAKGKKKGDKKKKGKKEKAPKKGAKVIILEYLVDSGIRKEARLTENKDTWLEDNAQLQSQVDSLQQELEAAIALLRRQEADEKHTCADTLAEQDRELRQTETVLKSEQRQHTSEVDALTEDLGDLSEEVEDVNDQVHYWRNYPHIQNVEKKTNIRELKKEIRAVDDLYDAFEVQLDGNFRYMQSHLTAHHTERLERAKQTAALHELRKLSLSAHSDLSGQEALCLQTVLLRAQGDTLRNLLDAIDGENLALRARLVPLRRPQPPPQLSQTASSATTGGSEEPERHLRLESLTALLTTLRPSPQQAQLVARVRDTTLAALHPDEDELRARKLAARAAAARPSCATAAASLSAAAASEMSSVLSTDSQAQLLPFEFPLQATARSLAAQTLRSFEWFVEQPHWWRVYVPEPRRRTWPVTEPLLAEYAERPAVYDLAGPKVICESPSVSSAHASDEWQLSKAGREQHLQQRSDLSITPVESVEETASSASAETGLDEATAQSETEAAGSAQSVTEAAASAKSVAEAAGSAKSVATAAGSARSLVKAADSAKSATAAAAGSARSIGTAANSSSRTAAVASSKRIAAKTSSTRSAALRSSSMKNAAVKSSTQRPEAAANA